MTRHHGCVGAAAELGQCWWGLPPIDACLVRIVEPPRDSIQHTCDAVLRDAPAEKGIALESAERIILNLRMRWRRALSDKVEVHIGAERGRIEQNKPYVYSQF